MYQKRKNTSLSSAVVTILLVPVLLLIFVIFSHYWSSVDRKLPRLDMNETNSAIRGSIITKDNYIVANSTKLYKVSVDSRSIDPHKLDLFVNLYCIYTGDSPKRVKKAIQNSKGTTILSYKIDAKTATHLKELNRRLNLKKVFVSFLTPNGRSNPPIRMSVTQSGEKREYNVGNSLTPIIGYINKREQNGITKVVGIKGIENYYEYYIAPVKDEFIIGPRDIGGNIILERSSKRSGKIDGYDTHINIPLSLQKSLEKMVDESAMKYDAREIILGILNSKTGEILSLVTNLRYDPSNITKKDFKNLNLSATEYSYEVGSVMKPIVFSIAYDNNLVKPSDRINTYNGAYKLGSRTIRDTHPAASMSATDVIVHSSNIGMIVISSKLSGQAFYDGLLKFGLSQQTGIDLPYEQRGNIPSIKDLDKKIYKATVSYGYGLQATFIQLLSAYQAFNNSGISISPRIVGGLKLKDKEYGVNEAEKRTILSKETADEVKKMLIETVVRGTGRKTYTPGLEIGGKTGTARIAKGGAYSNLYNSSFFGFANDQNSTYTIGVLVREPKKGSYYAAQNALPVFKNAVDIMVEQGFLKPKLDTNADTNVKIKDEEIVEIKD